jgi:hypothetical protein
VKAEVIEPVAAAVPGVLRVEAALERAHPEIVDAVVHLEPEGREGEGTTTA